MKKALKKILLAVCGTIVGGTLCGGVTMGIAQATQSSQKKSQTTYKPILTVDWDGYEADNLPYAISGQNYELFDVTATDAYGEAIAVNKQVYLHYLEPNQTQVTVKDDMFTPKHYGVYTVVYTARDSYGNTQTLRYGVACEQNTESMSMELSEMQTTVLAGFDVVLAEMDITNANGRVAIDITASMEGTDIVYDLTGDSVFTPLYAGSYVITYKVSDYTTTVEKSYKVEVASHDTPVLLEALTLPRYFIVGRNYVLPTVKAYQFSQGKPVEIVPSISVAYGNKKPQKIATDRAFSPIEEAALTFVYSFTYGGNAVTKTCLARAVDVGYGNPDKFDMAKYFYSDTALICANYNEVYAATQTEATEVTFINALSSNKIDFTFSFAEGQREFGAIEFYVTDSVDPSVQVKLSFIKDKQTESILKVNDGKALTTKTSFFDLSSFPFNYSEDANGACFKFANESLTITTDLAGNKFNGFPSGKVYFSYVLRQVTGTARVNMQKIGNQALYETAGDGMEPVVSFNAYAGELCEIGDVITIDRIYVQDMLDYEYTVKYSVLSPSGDFVISEESVLLNEMYSDYTKSYTIRFREQGIYIVNMYVSDSSGNEATYAYAIKVGDATPPSIELAEEVQNEITLGATIKIADVSVWDDTSKECKLFVCVIAPYLSTYQVEIGDNFRPLEKGVYKICYTVTDEAGNLACLTYECRVV